MKNEEPTKMPRKPRSVEEAISELERELHVRERCFDRWVQEGRLSAVEACDRLDRLMSALSLLETVQTAQESANTHATAAA